MNNYIPADKLLAEINRLNSHVSYESKDRHDDGLHDAYKAVKGVITALQQETPSDWSAEDEEMLDAMVDIVANSLYEPLCPREGMLTWLKALRSRTSHYREQAEVDLAKLKNKAELIANEIMMGVQANKYHTCIYDKASNDFNHSHLLRAALKGVELGLNAKKEKPNGE